MSINQVIDIEYRTGYLNYDKIRKGIIQNKDKLIENGYTCSWTQDLDLNALQNSHELSKTGYMIGNNNILTSFDKEGLPFIIKIFPKSQRAKVHGDNHIYQNEFEDVKQDFAKFAELTGINLKLEQTSEPY